MVTRKPSTSDPGLTDFGGNLMENGQQAELVYQHGVLFPWPFICYKLRYTLVAINLDIHKWLHTSNS